MSENDTAAPPPSQKPTKVRVSPRVLRVALGVSVALNLAVAGLVIGALVSREHARARPEMARDLAFGPIAEALRPEDRRALRDYLQARAPELRSAMAQRRQDVTAIQSALRAEPFDPASFLAAVNQMQDRLETQLALGFEALILVVVDMPAEERRALADRLDKGLRRQPQHAP